MENIENLYKNVNVEKKRYCEFDNECPFLFGHKCEDCDVDYKPEGYIYPPFTAEKQIKLIKWMIKTKHRYFMQDIIADDFSETLAGVFNFYWQYLTDEEKQQIKEILE